MPEGTIENNEAILMYFGKIKKDISEIDRNLISTIAEIKRIEREENPIVAAKLIPAYQDKVTELKRLRSVFSDLSEKVYENIITEEKSQTSYEQTISNEDGFDDDIEDVMLSFQRDYGYENEDETILNSESVYEDYLEPEEYELNASYEQATQDKKEFNDDLFEDDYDEMYGNDPIQATSSTIQTNTLHGQAKSSDDEFNDDLFEDDYDEMYGNDSEQVTSSISQADTLHGQAKSSDDEFNDDLFEDDYDEMYGNDSVQVTSSISQADTLHRQAKSSDDEFNDDLFEDEIKIENIKAFYKDGKYKLYFERIPKSNLDKLMPMPRVWSDTSENLYKKQNLPERVKKIFEEKDYNLYNFIKKELGEGYALDYLNNRLNFEMEYTLDYSKELSFADNIRQYKIAEKQEKYDNVNVNHSSFISKLVSLYNKGSYEVSDEKNKTINAKKESNKKDSFSKTSKNKSKMEHESAVKSTWDALSSVRANYGQSHSNESNLVQTNTSYDTNYSDDNNITNRYIKNNSFFKRAKFKIATITGIVLLALGCFKVTSMNNGSNKNDNDNSDVSISSVVNIDEPIQNIIKSTELEETVQNTQDVKYSFDLEVNDVLTLVYRNDSGDLMREYLLSSDKFGDGEKYGASKCDGNLFKISSIIVYNKDNNETIATIKDKGITIKSLYGKYGADIGINLCLNVCDENLNVIDEEKHNLNYDEYARFSDDVKQRIAESYSKEFAKENDSDKTTESEPSEEQLEETRESQSNDQNQASYVDSDNNAHIVDKDKDGNITSALQWTSGSDGSGTTGSARCLDCDSYKISLVVAREDSVVHDSVDVKKSNKSVEQIVNELYKTYGNDIEIVYNFDGYEDGKLTEEYLGFSNKKAYDEFNSEKTQDNTLSEEDGFNREIENTLAQNKMFNGYKLTLHM